MADPYAEDRIDPEPTALDADPPAIEAAASSTYKVLGEAALPDGAGVLGHNTSTTGVSYGV